ncbi:MAG: hypothetical protein ABSC42_15385 [Tepidisphaeraceae bacterium]|jgi:lipopolysaccharide biosynthesis regulator YciM
MKKAAAILAPIALAAGICGILKADDSSPPPAPLQGNAEYVWFVEHQAAIDKDAEASGVQAVIEAKNLMGSKGQPAIDFFTKALYDSKSPAVRRQIRLTLSDLYKEQGQTDKALDQLQQLIMDQ